MGPLYGPRILPALDLSRFVRQVGRKVANKQLRARLAFEDRVGDGRDRLQIGPYHDPDQGPDPLP